MKRTPTQTAEALYKTTEVYPKEQAIERMAAFFSGNVQSFANDQLSSVCDELAASLENITDIATDEEHGDLEERLEEAFGRDDIMTVAATALAKYKLMKRATLSPYPPRAVSLREGDKENPGT